MAIEIRELIIRTNIVDENSVKESRSSSDHKPVEEKIIIDRCVEKVLRKLSKRKDR
jgi:hypothetical protein